MKALLLLAVIVSSLFSISVPPQYADVSTPLFEARAAFYRIPADNTLREAVIQYAVMCDRVEEFGYKSSHRHDKQAKKE